ncbi:hypothetical protein, partial [Taibaiella soli]
MMKAALFTTFVTCSICILAFGKQVKAQTKNVQLADEINELLLATAVNINSLDLAIGGNIDLKQYTPLFYERTPPDGKFDSVSHGHAVLQVGKLVKVDSAVVSNTLLKLYVSGTREFSGTLMPIDFLMAATLDSNTFEKNDFMIHFLCKLSYLSQIPIDSIYIFCSTNPKKESNAALPSESKLDIVRNFVLYFDNEMRVCEIKNRVFDINGVKDGSWSMKHYMNIYQPRAMVTYEFDFGNPLFNDDLSGKE